MLLLIAFPLLVLIAVFAVVYFTHFDQEGNPHLDLAIQSFIQVIPFVLIAVGIWFCVAYFGNSAMINLATGSKSLERKENMRIYNLVENLCISVGMKMPKVNIIESAALNAFASGINEKSYSVTLTRGIIDTLNDEELEGVIAHELTHIRNKDVRLLIVTIVFVGIFSFIVQIAFRSLLFSGMSSNRKNKDDGKGLMLIILIVSVVAYFLSILFKLALSRRREYLADAGAVEMTKNPLALANALRKISGNSKIESVKSEDVESMFIENIPGDSEDDSMGFLGGLGGLFSTHPPIDKRIQVLEQF
jgi:heat shock protein HtpX